MSTLEELLKEIKEYKKLIDLASKELDLIREAMKNKYIWITIEHGDQISDKIKVNLNNDIKFSIEDPIVNEIDRYCKIIDKLSDRIKHEQLEY